MTTRISATSMGPKNVIIEEKHVDTEIDANQPTELLPLEMSEHHGKLGRLTGETANIARTRS